MSFIGSLYITRLFSPCTKQIQICNVVGGGPRGYESLRKKDPNIQTPSQHLARVLPMSRLGPSERDRIYKNGSRSGRV